MAKGKTNKKGHLCKGKTGKYCSRIIILIYLSLLLISACGYQFIGGGEILSSYHTKMAIPIFYNNTFEPLLETKVTHFLKREFISRGKWKIVNDVKMADLVLKGKIVSFGTRPIALDSENRASEYRVTIGIVVILEETGGNRIVMEKSNINASADYLAYSDITANRSAQDRAIEEACKLLAEDLRTRLLEIVPQDHANFEK